MRAPRRAIPIATMIAAAFAVLASACATASGPHGRRAADVDDSVSTTYGSRQPRSAITGAVSVIRRDELDAMHGASIVEMLAGRVPGLQVLRTSDGYTLRVRGASSFLGTDEPLCVIDGVPIRAGSIGQALSMLSPRDIARIEVLKDAGAAAAYGSRGGNGVIVITTRR